MLVNVNGGQSAKNIKSCAHTVQLALCSYVLLQHSPAMATEYNMWRLEFVYLQRIRPILTGLYSIQRPKCTQQCATARNPWHGGVPARTRAQDR